MSEMVVTVGQLGNGDFAVQPLANRTTVAQPGGATVLPVSIEALAIPDSSPLPVKIIGASTDGVPVNVQMFELQHLDGLGSFSVPTETLKSIFTIVPQSEGETAPGLYSGGIFFDGQHNSAQFITDIMAFDPACFVTVSIYSGSSSGNKCLIATFLPVMAVGVTIFLLSMAATTLANVAEKQPLPALYEIEYSVTGIGTGVTFSLDTVAMNL